MASTRSGLNWGLAVCAAARWLSWTVESRPEPQLRAGNDSNFSQGTNRIEPYRSTATHVNPIICRSRRTTSASASGAHIRQTESTNLVPSERSTVRSSRTPTSRFVSSCTTSPGVLRSPQPPLSTLGGRRNERTPADRQTSARHQCRITPCRRNAVHTSCCENATPSTKAAAQSSTQAAFIATHEGASARSSCMASTPQA